MQQWRSRQMMLGAITAIVLGLALAVASDGVLGGPFWPSPPAIHPDNAIDGSSLALPFTVRNTGALAIRSGRFVCGIAGVYARDAAGKTILVRDMALVMGVTSLAAGEQKTFTCDVSPLLQLRFDGTLSPPPPLVAPSDLLIHWQPPFEILKICVWVRGEYKAFGFLPWRFTTPIFQWPTRPDLHRWVEDPASLAASPNPLTKLAAPDVSLSLATTRPGTMPCGAELRPGAIFALVTAPGQAMMVFEQVWYKWLWNKLRYG
jgi:hypothetical protein